MKPSDIYGHRPMQMDDYGMAPEHYDSCNNCNGQDNQVEPDKTEEDETTDG